MTELIETYVGFDSSWTDNPKAPGAICAICMAPGMLPRFYEPRLARFSEALRFVEEVNAGSGYTLIAIDQPTIVPNASSMRPAERVAASVISWIGGGVQPANRSKVGMFCDRSPIWPFLSALAAADDPVAARAASSGRHVMEVFPALALATIEPSFYRRGGAPKYNPANAKRYRAEDWRRVCSAVAGMFDLWNLADLTAWCRDAGGLAAPRKADQDRLDAMICLAVALHWRLAPPDQSAMIGDLLTGYIVAPVSSDVRSRLVAAAMRKGVAIDGRNDGQGPK